MSPASAAVSSSHITDSGGEHVLSPGELAEQARLLAMLLYVVHHLFGDLKKVFSQITDPRRPDKTTYAVEELAFTAIFMFLCGLKARRQIGILLRHPMTHDVVQEVFRAGICPHGDTLNDAFGLMDPGEFQRVLCRMVFCLIRKKVLYPYRLLERYYVVAIDGTRTLTRKTRHCPRCLTQTHGGKTTYYHMVVEAKVVTPDGFAIPIMTEFVENEDGNSKQDCELKAFYRLADKLKAYFPQLPLLLSLDSLFACGPVFHMCEQYGWKFMVVHKDGSIPTVTQEFESLSPLQPENRLTRRQANGNARKEQRFRWVNDINFKDTDNREHFLDVIECIETEEDGGGVGVTKRYRWVTNMGVTERNVVPLANDGGRPRWKVENEGFNVQKNGGYGLTHMYSMNENSAKIFHILMQIAHLWMQLLAKGGIKRWFPGGMGSVKNVGFRLLEAWRNAQLPGGMRRWITQWRLQIRFCPDTS